jgi:hypothetical protein
MNLEKMLRQSEILNESAHAEYEKKKSGELRVGNSGCLVAASEFKGVRNLNSPWGVTGSCHRQTILRHMGIDEPLKGITNLFFTDGRAAEPVVADLLAMHGDLTVKQEEECSVEWKTQSGRRVTGRPDFLSGWPDMASA